MTILVYLFLLSAVFALRVRDGSSAANSLHDVHGNSTPHFIVCVEYPAFHNNDCPLGLGDFQQVEQVFDRRTIWNLDLHAL
jgi:hypothetical protein